MAVNILKEDCDELVKKYSNHIAFPIFLHYTQTKYNKDGKQIERIEYAYNEWRDPAGYKRTCYKYNKNGKVTEKKEYFNERLFRTISYEYTDDKIIETECDEEGEVIKKEYNINNIKLLRTIDENGQECSADNEDRTK